MTHNAVSAATRSWIAAPSARFSSMDPLGIRRSPSQDSRHTPSIRHRAPPLKRHDPQTLPLPLPARGNDQALQSRTLFRTGKAGGPPARPNVLSCTYLTVCMHPMASGFVVHPIVTEVLVPCETSRYWSRDGRNRVSGEPPTAARSPCRHPSRALHHRQQPCGTVTVPELARPAPGQGRRSVVSRLAVSHPVVVDGDREPHPYRVFPSPCHHLTCIPGALPEGEPPGRGTILRGAATLPWMWHHACAQTANAKNPDMHCACICIGSPITPMA